jgi:hypothetical protein
MKRWSDERAWGVMLALALAFAWAGCGSAMPPACAPGETQACVCSDGRSGSQTCNGLGTGYSSCFCSTTPPPGCPAGACTAQECGLSTRCDGVQCGSCAAGLTCSNGVCVTSPTRCAGRVCGSDGAGGSCGNCPASQVCTVEGQCTARPCSPACGRGFVCQNAACAVDPNALWAITVVDGTVAMRDAAGEAWDPFGGAPDPYFCLTADMVAQQCSGFVSDSFSPVWNHRFATTMRASSLLTSVVVQFVDYDDGSGDDPMQSTAPFRFAASDFAIGRKLIDITDASGRSTGFRATLTLTPQ